MQRIWILMMLAIGVMTSPAIAASPEKTIMRAPDVARYSPIRLAADGSMTIRQHPRR